MMRLSIFSILVLSSLLLCHFQAATFALEKSYIVYLGSHAHGSEPSKSDIENASNSHYQLLGSVCKSIEKAKEKIFYSYCKSINGFAAFLEEEEAAELAEHPDVVSIFLNKEVKLQTTHSWSFLGLEGENIIPKSSLWTRARFGEDIIIANVDTGVWPESKSFSDEGMGPVPSKWRGFCQNDTMGVHCNRKLIGARFFNKAALAYAAKHHIRPDSSFYTSRDLSGHGTHTLSTAAGNFVVGANVFGGRGNGTAKGGSPKARVAAYKVCWPVILQCQGADIMAAIDAAIYDGVNVISLSLGNGEEYFKDAVSIGAFHAIQSGIVVVGSAGNMGPAQGRFSNSAPWLLSVGAATIDRQFASYVTLGNGKRLIGESLSTNGSAAEKFYPLISGEEATNKSAEIPSEICFDGTLDSEKVKGNIVVCPSSKHVKNDLELGPLLAGAVGMIVTNDETSQIGIEAYHYTLPGAELDLIDSKFTYGYINSTKNSVARIGISRTFLKTKPAPVVAGFSSRGPNPFDESILKPDIIAPGVDIIAANSLESGVEPRSPFVALTGTSMAAPHVAGVVGLLKAVHPDWSPASIQSAIITTATVLDNNKQPLLDLANNREATPFARGAGHINPNNAADPGLVYDLTVDDYLDHLCALGYNQRQINLISSKPHLCPKILSLADFNYPSITVANLNNSITVNRTVKNVGPASTYTVHVKSPEGVLVSIEPTTLKFTKVGEAKKFQVSLRVDSKKAPKGYVFGELKWSNGEHQVTSPLVVKQQQDVGL